MRPLVLCHPFIEAAPAPAELTPLEIATKRHAARTPEQAQAIQNRWFARQGYTNGFSAEQLVHFEKLEADLSVKLAKAREEKTGREVPLKFIEENNREISKLIPKLIEGEVYDELYLWDTNINGTPRLILKQIDGVLTIEDEDLYLRFLSKAN